MLHEGCTENTSAKIGGIMRSILLVEDEKMIRYGIYVMIENSGVPYKKITECRNGKEAVECLKKENYDLVLTDIKMPIMGGLELAEWIENNMEKEKQPMIIAISGYAEFEYARGMMQHHALNYLLKPVDREELAKVLWNAENIFKEKGNANEDDFDNENASLTRTSRHKMETALEYIRKNYGKTIDMAEVSNHVSMNYSMFSSTFKEYTGDNFSTYLRKIRIEKSKKLLEKTDLNVNEIASLGSNVKPVIQNENCAVLMLNDATGEGVMTVY